MHLYFNGAEQPIYLRQLDALGVKHIAISFYEWQRRFSSDDIYRHVPEHMKVIITPGVAIKEDVHWGSFATDYLEFCERNADQTIIYDLDAAHCPPDIRRHVRDQLTILPNVVVFPTEDESLDVLASKYERIGLNANTAKSLDPNDLRRISASLHGSNITDYQRLRLGRFVATTSFAWLSCRRYGEIWVFARNKLHHYNADKLAAAVRAHRRDIEAYGVDPEAMLANDKDALTEVAIKSLMAMAESLGKRPRDRRIIETVGASDPEGGNDMVDSGAAGPGALVAGSGARPINERERVLLPVIAVNAQGEPEKMTTRGTSLRQCDACYLSEACPKYLAESACAYNFPIEIRNDSQWEQAAQTIVEMQFERVAFAKFAEEIEGSGLSPRVGQEMDRWFKLLGSVKDLKAPTPSANPGALTKIFGPKPGAPLPPQLGDGTNDPTQEEILDIEEEGGEEGEAEYADAGPAYD
jgi:hypothetical protein